MADGDDGHAAAAARLLAYAQALGPDAAGRPAPPPLTLVQLALVLQLNYYACVRALKALTRRRQLQVRVFPGPRYQIQLPTARSQTRGFSLSAG
jgi:hypothetical protein